MNIREGQTAIIDRVTGEDATAIRLMEMGFVSGVEVRYVGCAPLGDPLEFEILGFRISLRRRELQRILFRKG